MHDYWDQYRNPPYASSDSKSGTGKQDFELLDAIEYKIIWAVPAGCLVCVLDLSLHTHAFAVKSYSTIFLTCSFTEAPDGIIPGFNSPLCFI